MPLSLFEPYGYVYFFVWFLCIESWSTLNPTTFTDLASTVDTIQSEQGTESDEQNNQEEDFSPFTKMSIFTILGGVISIIVIIIIICAVRKRACSCFARIRSFCRINSDRQKEEVEYTSDHLSLSHSFQHDSPRICETEEKTKNIPAFSGSSSPSTERSSAPSSSLTATRHAMIFREAWKRALGLNSEVSSSSSISEQNEETSDVQVEHNSFSLLDSFLEIEDKNSDLNLITQSLTHLPREDSCTRFSPSSSSTLDTSAFPAFKQIATEDSYTSNSIDAGEISQQALSMQDDANNNVMVQQSKHQKSDPYPKWSTGENNPCLGDNRSSPPQNQSTHSEHSATAPMQGSSLEEPSSMTETIVGLADFHQEPTPSISPLQTRRRNFEISGTSRSLSDSMLESFENVTPLKRRKITCTDELAEEVLEEVGSEINHSIVFPRQLFSFSQDPQLSQDDDEDKKSDSSLNVSLHQFTSDQIDQHDDLSDNNTLPPPYDRHNYFDDLSRMPFTVVDVNDYSNFDNISQRYSSMPGAHHASLSSRVSTSLNDTEDSYFGHNFSRSSLWKVIADANDPDFVLPSDDPEYSLIEDIEDCSHPNPESSEENQLSALSMHEENQRQHGTTHSDLTTTSTPHLSGNSWDNHHVKGETHVQCDLEEKTLLPALEPSISCSSSITLTNPTITNTSFASSGDSGMLSHEDCDANYKSQPEIDNLGHLASFQKDPSEPHHFTCDRQYSIRRYFSQKSDIIPDHVQQSLSFEPDTKSADLFSYGLSKGRYQLSSKTTSPSYETFFHIQQDCTEQEPSFRVPDATATDSNFLLPSDEPGGFSLADFEVCFNETVPAFQRQACGKIQNVMTQSNTEYPFKPGSSSGVNIDNSNNTSADAGPSRTQKETLESSKKEDLSSTSEPLPDGVTAKPLSPIKKLEDSDSNLKCKTGQEDSELPSTHEQTSSGFQSKDTIPVKKKLTKVFPPRRPTGYTNPMLHVRRNFGSSLVFPGKEDFPFEDDLPIYSSLPKTPPNILTPSGSEKSESFFSTEKKK